MVLHCVGWSKSLKQRTASARLGGLMILGGALGLLGCSGLQRGTRDADGAPERSAIPPAAAVPELRFRMYNAFRSEVDPRWQTVPRELGAAEVLPRTAIMAEAPPGTERVRFTVGQEQYEDRTAPFLWELPRSEGRLRAGDWTVRAEALREGRASTSAWVSLRIRTDVPDEDGASPQSHRALRYWLTDDGRLVWRDASGHFRDQSRQVVLRAEEVWEEEEGEQQVFLRSRPERPQLAFAFALLVPPSFSPKVRHPLVVHLHHGWERFRGTDNDLYSLEVEPLLSGPRSLTHSEQRLRTPAVVLIPQLPRITEVDGVTHEWGAFSALDNEEGSVTLASEPSPSFERVEWIIDELLEGSLKTDAPLPQIDDARIYLTGHSMGGLGAWDWLARRPRRWAAAVILAGYADPRRVSAFEAIPIWSFHHELDGYNPFVGSETVHRLLSLDGSGSEMRFTPLRFDTGGRGDVAHFETPHAVWNDRDDVLQWLFSQVAGDSRR